MWPWTSYITSLCLGYPFLKMKRIMPTWLSITWGYWQSKWVHVQCMRYSKERCWLNVKFAIAIYMSSFFHSAPHLGPWKGLCIFWRCYATGFCLSSPALWYYFLWVPDEGNMVRGGASREWSGWWKDPTPTLTHDGGCGVWWDCAPEGIVGPLTQGATFWAGAGGTKGHRKGSNRGGSEHKSSIMKSMDRIWDFAFLGSLISWYVANVWGRCLVICNIGDLFFFLLPVNIWR